MSYTILDNNKFIHKLRFSKKCSAYKIISLKPTIILYICYYNRHEYVFECRKCSLFKPFKQMKKTNRCLTCDDRSSYYRIPTPLQSLIRKCRRDNPKSLSKLNSKVYHDMNFTEIFVNHKIRHHFFND
jgi:hypothetical protein